MAVKFADEIAKEIKKREPATVPKGYFTGYPFEKWMRRERRNENGNGNENRGNGTGGRRM